MFLSLWKKQNVLIKYVYTPKHALLMASVIASMGDLRH